MSDLENQDSSSSKAADASVKPEGATDAPAQAAAETTGSSDSKTDKISASPAKDPAPKPNSTAMTILPPIRETFGNMRGERIGGAPVEEPTSGLFLKAAAVLVVLGATGALAMAGANYFHGGDTTIASAKAATENETLKQTIARLDTEVATLRINLDQAVKANSSQIGRISDRIDRVEKAQVEPNAKLAKLTEAVDKLKPTSASTQITSPQTSSTAAQATTAPTPTNVASNVDTTGSVPAPANSSVAAAAAPAVKKPQIIDGWVLRNVSDGGALVEGPLGLFSIYPGDPLPGLNRVEAIRRDGGRWVVVTRKGLIVSR